MIAVDASAILAIYFREPERQDFVGALEGSASVISPVNHWEVLARTHRVHGPAGVRRAEDMLESLGVQVVTMSAASSRMAHSAFVRFGKGVGGPLNLGDCFAYALAQSEGDGLLFKGEDFPKTDIRSVI